MTDESADTFVKKALEWNRGAPFEVVVGLLSVPSVTRAFERQGCVATEGDRPGRLIVTRFEDAIPEAIDVLARRQQLGAKLILYVRANQMDNTSASEVLGATAGELAHLRMGRYHEVGDERLTEMMARLGD